LFFSYVLRPVVFCYSLEETSMETFTLFLYSPSILPLFFLYASSIIPLPASGVAALTANFALQGHF